MSRRYTIFFLRKHRKKLTHSHYRAKWEQTLTQQEAMKIFKGSLLLGGSDNNNNFLATLIHSFNLYNSHPTPQAYHFLIGFLSRRSRLHQIPQLLDHLENVEKFDSPESVFIDLIKFYGESNRIEDALHLFDRIPRFRCVPSADSLDALLSVLCRDTQGLRWVPRVFRKSREMNVRFEGSTFKVLIAALCRINRVGHAIEIFNSMVSGGFGADPTICALLLSSLCEVRGPYGSFEVKRFLGELRKVGFCPHISDYKNVIRFLASRHMGIEAVDVLNQMKFDRIKPDISCYNMIISGMVEIGDYTKADKLFDELLVLGLVPDVCTYNACIKGLCKQNRVQEGLMMVGGMKELGCKPDSNTYNMLLEGFCENGEITRAKELLREMGSKGISRNTDTYRSLVNGLFNIEEINEGCALLEEAMKMGLFSALDSIFDKTILFLCQRGMMCTAVEVLQKMVRNNVSPSAKGWEALILSSGLEFSLLDCGSHFDPRTWFTTQL